MVRSSSNNGRYSQTKNKEDGERDIRESEVDGKGTYSDIDFEEDDKTDSSKEDSEGDAEEVKENMKEEKAAEDTTGQTEGVEGTSLPLTEKDQQSFEEQSEAGDDSNIETSSPAPPQTIMTAEGGAETHESPGGSTEKTELELLDSSKQPEKRTDKRTICAAVDKCGNAAKTEEELSSVTKPERGKYSDPSELCAAVPVTQLCVLVVGSPVQLLEICGHLRITIFLTNVYDSSIFRMTFWFSCHIDHLRICTYMNIDIHI
ncbi:uncharacterized protein LOC118772988 isoform X2 [Megalops cyprinoides]|uniref:uncharacterized protein LOC118772988 isoform X2 n=1 Tax=Megalops cyprinoides TaxID=118141 RepID=UPI0018654574|nr:uncharacterized protein LOC118772988 isoform X2 [Megalops cyprinoides]